MDNSVFDSINNIYKDKGYFELYGNDVFISIIIIFVLLLCSTYFFILNHKKNIQNNWNQQKCNPLYMPFAGLIVKNKNQSILDATSQNFMDCTKNTLQIVTNDALEPIHYVYSVINESLSEITSSINSVRAMFDKKRNNISEIASNVSKRTLNVTMPIINTSINAKDSMSKTHGILTTGVYQIFGLFTTTFSIFKFFINVFIGLLVILAASIIALWIVAIFFPPAAVAAGVSSALYIAILIPLLLVITIMSIIFKYSSNNLPPQAPGKSSCFDKDTIIEMNDGTYKKISDIKIGDVLKNNNKVTATMISTLGNNQMYNINNIFVTGCHKIYIDNKWVEVKNCNNSQLISNYNDKVYCLNTINKIIDINNNIFMDWDEVDDNEINKLKKYGDYDFNKIFNNGLSENTRVKTMTGEKKITDLIIGEQLSENNYVLAKIEVLPDDLHIIENDNEYQQYFCTSNLIQDISFKFDDSKKCESLYQIKTTLGYYFIDNYKINDYDSIIEACL